MHRITTLMVTRERVRMLAFAPTKMSLAVLPGFERMPHLFDRGFRSIIIVLYDADYLMLWGCACTHVNGCGPWERSIYEYLRVASSRPCTHRHSNLLDALWIVYLRTRTTLHAKTGYVDFDCQPAFALHQLTSHHLSA